MKRLKGGVNLGTVSVEEARETFANGDQMICGERRGGLKRDNGERQKDLQASVEGNVSVLPAMRRRRIEEEY